MSRVSGSYGLGDEVIGLPRDSYNQPIYNKLSRPCPPRARLVGGKSRRGYLNHKGVGPRGLSSEIQHNTALMPSSEGTGIMCKHKLRSAKGHPSHDARKKISREALTSSEGNSIIIKRKLRNA